MTANELTEFLIEKLKGEIDYLQKEASSASRSGDSKKCGELLYKQALL
ncbi:hypothetical protein ACSV5M_09240 [Cellvibrio sp. ARAG 10.3]